jgi:hypothetical protein
LAVYPRCILAVTLRCSIARQMTDAYLTDHGKAAFSRHRQLIETVNGLLLEHLHLAFPKVRTLAGLYARIAAKVATLNLVLLSNLLYHRPTFAPPAPLFL